MSIDVAHPAADQQSIHAQSPMPPPGIARSISTIESVKVPEKSSGCCAVWCCVHPIRWLALNHRRIYMRYFILVAMVLAYNFLGAFIFYYIEVPNEKEGIVDVSADLKASFEHVFDTGLEGLDGNETQIEIGNGTDTDMEQFVRSTYVSLLTTDGIYSGSTFFKDEDSDNNYMWTFASSFFFSVNVYTTVGYGSIAPSTKLGQLCVIIYAVITVPLTVIVVRSFGQWWLLHLTRLYGRIVVRIRSARGIETDPSEEFSMPFPFVFLILCTYLAIGTTIIYLYDDWSGKEPGTGLGMFECFYFCYLTITTIGFGDLMPSNATFSPFIALVFVTGMPIMKVMNRIIYVSWENLIIGLLTIFETRLEIAGGVRQAEEMAEELPEKEMPPSPRGSVFQAMDDEEKLEVVNNLTIRSLSALMRSKADVYDGEFGQAHVKPSELRN